MSNEHFAPLRAGFGKDPTKGGKFLDIEVYGGISVGGTITGETVIGGTISGTTISGSTITGGTVTGTTVNGGTIIGSDFYSDNWNGTIPLSLATRDAGASAGFAMDGSTGGAQFINIYADGGEIRTLTVSGTLTMGTGGKFRTSVTGSRIELTDTNNDRIDFFTGVSGETTSNNGYILADSLPTRGSLHLVGPFRTTEIEMFDNGGGADGISFIGSTFQFNNPILATNGSAAAPSISFTANVNTGIYRPTTDTLGLVAGGTEGIQISATYMFSLGNAVGEPAIKHSAAGNAATPTYAYVTDLDSGAYRVAADQLGWATAGVARMSLNATRLDVDSTFLQIPAKATTGDPASPTNGDMYVNTFDNTVRVYADAAWRDLATW